MILSNMDASSCSEPDRKRTKEGTEKVVGAGNTPDIYKKFL